jgi:hypothetical protein
VPEETFMPNTSVRRPKPPGSSSLPKKARVAGASVGVLAAALMVAGPAAAKGPDKIGDPLPDVPQGPVQVGLESVTRDIIAPLAGITAPGRPTMLYLVDQVGRLKELDLEARRPVATVPTVLDVSQLLVGPVDPKDERGSLGLPSPPTLPPATLPTSTPTHPKRLIPGYRQPSRCHPIRRDSVTSRASSQTTEAWYANGTWPPPPR